MSSLTIGVLALQGAFGKHLSALSSLGVSSIAVRTPHELRNCDGLIIPGGESSTMAKQMTYIGLWEAIKDFSKTKPLFGTCAGLILMAKEITESTPYSPLGIFDIAISRNAYGRQIDSFSSNISVQLPFGIPTPLKAIFIRAPRIESWGEEIEILATFHEKPILIQQGLHIGASFHPELSENLEIHKYFTELSENTKLQKTA
ncbi:MAG: 5'-phosphate synthase pdxT subunit [Chlamydiales bacterium]|jgi:5'-phosphate synthase pdxT subunit